MSAPTLAEVLQAVEGFGAIYHELHQSVEALREDLRRHDTASTRDRASLREQLLALQRSVDRRFDAVGREIDTHTEHLAEIRQTCTELHMRLADVEERLAILEADRAA